MSRFPALVLVLTANLLFAVTPHDLQRGLRTAYVGKLFSLRTPISYDVVHFNLEGKSTRPGSGEPWTTSGLFRVRKMSINHGTLVIDGDREIVVLNPAAEHKKLLLVPSERNIHVVIDLPPSTEDIPGVNLVLACIFVPGDLPARMAEAWKSEVDLSRDLDEIGKELPDGRVGTLAGDRPVYLLSADHMVRPMAIYRPEPRYSEKALFKRVSGTTHVRVVVNENGFPEILEVLQHLREGLDTRALAAVSQWRFKPALKDGTPVAAMVVVDVKFKLR